MVFRGHRDTVHAPKLHRFGYPVNTYPPPIS